MDNELHLDVKKIREKHGFTQQAFADALHVSLSIVKKWESKKDPKTYPKTENLLAMCELFNCDLDYLIGRIEEKKHDLKDICEITGLSESATEQIIEISQYNMSNSLSKLIEHELFKKLIYDFDLFLSVLKSVKENPGAPFMESNINGNGEYTIHPYHAASIMSNRINRDISMICDDLKSQRLQELQEENISIDWNKI